MNMERQRITKRVLFLLLGNALPLLLGLYGLKCIITLHGHLTEPNSQRMMHTFSLVPVEGMASVLAGLGYIFAALFAYLSAGSSPDEDQKMGWRILRGVVRWGSLPAMWFFGIKRILSGLERPAAFWGNFCRTMIGLPPSLHPCLASCLQFSFCWHFLSPCFNAKR